MTASPAANIATVNNFRNGPLTVRACAAQLDFRRASLHEPGPCELQYIIIIPTKCQLTWDIRNV